MAVVMPIPIETFRAAQRQRPLGTEPATVLANPQLVDRAPGRPRFIATQRGTATATAQQIVSVQPMLTEDGRQIIADGNTGQLFVDSTQAEMAAGAGPRRPIKSLWPDKLFAPERKKKANRARWARDRGVDPLAELLGPKVRRPGKTPPKPVNRVPIVQVPGTDELRQLWGDDIEREVVAAQVQQANYAAQFIQSTGAGTSINQVGIADYSGTGGNIGGSVAFYSNYIPTVSANQSVAITTQVPTLNLNVTAYSTASTVTANLRVTNFGTAGQVVMDNSTTQVFNYEAAADLQAVHGINMMQGFLPPEGIPNIDLAITHKIDPATFRLIPVFKFIVRDPAGWTPENLNRVLAASTHFPAGVKVVYEDPQTGMVADGPFERLIPEEQLALSKEHEKIQAAQREEAEKRRVEAEKKRELAKSRALGLLIRFMTPKQREEYQRHKFFHVVTRKRHRYRINQGRAGNIVRVNRRGKPMRGYCIVAPTELPDADSLLSQKLLLEANEDEFLKIANPKPVKHRIAAYGQAQVNGANYATVNVGNTLAANVDTFTPAPAGVPITDHLVANGVDVHGTGHGVAF